MPGDLYGISVIAAVLGSLIVGASGYRNHSEVCVSDLDCLETALYITVMPCIVAMIAMCYGNAALAVACFLATIGAGLLWFVAYFIVLFA